MNKQEGFPDLLGCNSFLEETLYTLSTANRGSCRQKCLKTVTLPSTPFPLGLDSALKRFPVPVRSQDLFCQLSTRNHAPSFWPNLIPFSICPFQCGLLSRCNIVIPSEFFSLHWMFEHYLIICYVLNLFQLKYKIVMSLSLR